MEELVFDIKSGFFRKSQKLVINPDFILLGDTIFLKDEITEYRYGVHWIRFRIPFGRQYKIFIRNKDNRILTIKFKTFSEEKLKNAVFFIAPSFKHCTNIISGM